MCHPVALVRSVSIAAVAACALVIPSAGRAAAPAGAEAMLKQIGSTRGVVALLDDTQCELALALAKASELVIYVQLSDPAAVDSARRAADAAGLYGTRIFVERGDPPAGRSPTAGEGPSRIHLADDVADAVIACSDAPAAARAEMLRVLRPEGKGIAAGAEFTKPFPAGVDDWSHHYHGPDNNSQSRDLLARAPYLTQFVAEPRYAPAPQAAVASAGRVFMAFGNVAWHEREEPMLNTLIAVSGFNGTMLWRRPLPQGIMVDRCTLIATPDTLYLADDVSCKLIDAATGAVRDEITLPADLGGGTFWKWMALEGGRLFALIGESEPPDPDAKWRSTNHGWPWGGISQGYNQQDYKWGFAKVLVAVDPKSKKVLWHHREDPPIDSRATCMKNGRIYITHFGEYAACIDAATGREVWRRTAAKDPQVFEAIGAYRPGHGYVGGWKSTVYLRCTDKALYFLGPQVNWLTALSAEDGRFLWKGDGKDLHMVVRDDGLYTTAPQSKTGQTQKLDPMSGSVLAAYDVQRRACTRSTGGPDGIFFRAGEGTIRLDTATGKPQAISPMRPSCHVGVIVASGHLYWVPWACDCNLQMFGAISCGPAGNFDFAAKATDAERLETAPGNAAVAKFDASPNDWPAYRRDNVRSAKTAVAVPEKVRLLWQYEPKSACEATAPVAAGGLVFTAGLDGIVRAFGAADGRAKWTAYTGGPVRYPPTVAGGRVFVGSADGWAYAFEAATGRLLWRFRAAPAERKIPVYGALVSTWPVACGVLVDGDTAYLAAGMNNFDGTYLYALDASTGRIKWQNGGAGHLDSFSKRGVAAQGDMLLDGGNLYLAGGNVVSPGIFEASSGKCLNQPPPALGTPAPRGRELVLANGQVNVRGQPLYSTTGAPVFDKKSEWEPAAIAAGNANIACIKAKAGQGPAWLLSARAAKDNAEIWAQPIPAEPVRWGMAVDRDGRIVVSLRSGRVLCFGAEK